MASELGDNITPESQEQQNIANQRNDAANSMHREVLTSGNVVAKAQDASAFQLEKVSSTEHAEGERCSNVNNYVRFASAVNGMPAEGVGSKADIRKVFDDFAVLNPDRAAFFRSAESKVFTT